MKLEFISNTGFFLENNDAIFGFDLWETSGAFEGSWHHYPPLRKTKIAIEDCNFVYISHIHPDHFDLNTLLRLDRQCIFIVPNYFGCLIERILKSVGFENIFSLKPFEKVKIIDNLQVTLFPQFENNKFHESSIGSLIDSALMVEWDEWCILDCNDNYLNDTWIQYLDDNYPRLDLVLAPHSASGPYPASFLNLSDHEKNIAANKLERKYREDWVKDVIRLNPRFAIPCAAEYVVVGRHWKKNEFLGLVSPTDVVRDFENSAQVAGTNCKAIALDCGTTLDLRSGALGGLAVRDYSLEDRMRYAESLQHISYPYEWEHSFADVDFWCLFEAARENLWQKQTRLNWFEDYVVGINIFRGETFVFNFADRNVFSDDQVNQGFHIDLVCVLPRQLLYRILTGKTHWNNAEGGLLIDFYRQPDVYKPEAHVLLSFLNAC